MPNLGFDTASARLIEWLKQPGEQVAKGEAIAIIESDKANVELEAIASGILLELLAPAGTEFDVGAVIARVGAPQDLTPGTPARIAISPVAQRMAEEHGLDAGQVQGSGSGGRITRRDIERHLETAQAPTSSIMPLARRRCARLHVN